MSRYFIPEVIDDASVDSVLKESFRALKIYSSSESSSRNFLILCIVNCIFLFDFSLVTSALVRS